MKWKIVTITLLTLFFQMLFLFLSWQQNIFTSEFGYLYEALIVLFLGLTGGLILKSFKSTKNENKALENFIKYVAVFILTLGVYFVFIPVMAIISNGGVASLILILGFLIPVLMSNLRLKKLEKSL